MLFQFFPAVTGLTLDARKIAVFHVPHGHGVRVMAVPGVCKCGHGLFDSGGIRVPVGCRLRLGTRGGKIRNNKTVSAALDGTEIIADSYAVNLASGLAQPRNPANSRHHTTDATSLPPAMFFGGKLISGARATQPVHLKKYVLWPRDRRARRSVHGYATIRSLCKQGLLGFLRSARRLCSKF